MAAQSKSTPNQPKPTPTGGTSTASQDAKLAELRQKLKVKNIAKSGKDTYNKAEQALDSNTLELIIIFVSYIFYSAMVSPMVMTCAIISELKSKHEHGTAIRVMLLCIAIPTIIITVIQLWIGDITGMSYIIAAGGAVLFISNALSNVRSNKIQELLREGMEYNSQGVEGENGSAFGHNTKQIKKKQKRVKNKKGENSGVTLVPAQESMDDEADDYDFSVKPTDSDNGEEEEPEIIYEFGEPISDDELI